MKNAQDAVREIREWPVQKYLIENEDGSIEFSDNKPGRVVCSKEEFMEAKSSVVKSVEDAVRACCGVWPTESVNHLGMGRGWSGGYVGDEPDFLAIDATCIKVTRAEFEEEARRQGYVEGFKGHPDDVAFKGGPLPVGWHGECSWGQKVNWVECIKLLGNLIARRKFHWDSREWIVDSIEPDYEFRPLKSDRERWVELAVDAYKSSKKGIYTNCELKCIELIYDAMASGELPTPEAK